MLTQQAVLDAVRGGRASECIDHRDYGRLSEFFTPNDWSVLGFTLKEGIDPATVQVKPWTEEEIKKQLGSDLDFAFEKALGRRSISASLMYFVVKMWLWILEDDDLQNMQEDRHYGLPLFKAVAVKYGFPDKIEGFNGDEGRFAE